MSSTIRRGRWQSPRHPIDVRSLATAPYVRPYYVWNTNLLHLGEMRPINGRISPRCDTGFYKAFFATERCISPRCNSYCSKSNVCNHIIAIPLAINCRNGIYTVRSIINECNDGRHKCRPYKHDIINVKGNCYKKICYKLIFLLLPIIILFLPSILFSRDYAIYYPIDDSTKIGLTGMPYASYSTDKGTSMGLSLIMFEKNTLTPIQSGRDFRLRLDGEFSTEKEQTFSVDTSIPIRQREQKINLKLQYKSNEKDFLGLGNTDKNILNHFTKEQYVFKGNWLKYFSDYLSSGLAIDASGYKNSKFSDPIDTSQHKIKGFDHFYRAIGLGALVRYSDRLPNNFPTSGLFFTSQFTLYDKVIKSDFNFFTVETEYHFFLPIGEHILANQILSVNTSKDTPYHYLAEQGNAYLMRGYSTGRFLDNNLLAAQTEYRSPFIFWRMSAVAFVASAISYQDKDDIVPKNIHLTGGGGLRIAVDKDERINLRADVGISKEGYEVYLKFAEAF